MKKFMFLAALLLGISAATAQVKPVKKEIVNFGLKAGILVNNLSTRIENYTNRDYVGFTGGVFARFNIKRFHIQPEVLFSMQGGELAFNDPPGNYDIKFNTIEVPILLGFKVLDFKLINLRLQAGGYFAGNLTKSVAVIESNPQNEPGNLSSDNLSSINGGLIGGVGIDIWKFTIDGRYRWGLGNVWGDNELPRDNGAAFKTGIWEISVGFKIF